LVSGRTRIFGLIVSEITNPFFPEIVQAFEDTAVAHGYEILLTSTIHDPKRMEAAVRRMLERRVEGVAILTFGMEESLLEGLRFRKVPLVFVDVGPSLPRVSNIKINYQRGIAQAVQHLAELEHQRIAFITGPLSLKSAVTRKNAFTGAMKELGLGIDPSFLIEGDHTMEGGMIALDKLLKAGPLPSAVMCSNDVTAIGVMRQAYERGISVPQQLSVIGFDDLHLAQFMIPPLTTVRMSQSEIARLAFKALMNDVERKNHTENGTEYLLETDLVLRRSTAPANREHAPRTR